MSQRRDYLAYIEEFVVVEYRLPSLPPPHSGPPTAVRPTPWLAWLLIVLVAIGSLVVAGLSWTAGASSKQNILPAYQNEVPTPPGSDIEVPSRPGQD